MTTPEEQFQQEKPIRDWLYQHPAYDHKQVGPPPYTEEQAKKWRALYELVEAFESDFNVMAGHVVWVAQQRLEKETDPALQQIYRDFIAMAQAGKEAEHGS